MHIGIERVETLDHDTRGVSLSVTPPPSGNWTRRYTAVSTRLQYLCLLQILANILNCLMNLPALVHSHTQ